MEHSFTQTDITEGFDDNKNLKLEDWINTIPLNKGMTKEDAAKVNLPYEGADDEEIYQVATKLSVLRSSLNNKDDGVYCPVCHIASSNLEKLETPCPKCGRPLLRFGWN